MSLLPFLAIAFAAGTAALLARHRADLSGAVGIAGLALAAIAAASAPLLERLGLAPADGGAAGFLALGALVALLVVLAAAGVGTVPRSLPGAWLLTLGTAGLALLAPAPAAAVLLATAAGVVAVVPVLDPGAVSERGAMAALIAVRVCLLAALAALGAVALMEAAPADPAVAGTALVAVAAAVAARMGVIPLHRPAARLAGLVPLAALPLALVWAPSALAWVAPALLPGGLPPVERALVLVIALVAVVLAALAALIHDDLPHVVGYGAALDGGIALLAFAAPEAATGALRTWLLVAAVARTALTAWILATGGPAGIRRVGELRGWVRRSPLLGVVLLAIGVALVGWPGGAAWEARADLLRGALPEWLAGVAGVAGGVLGLASAAAVGRVLLAGIARPEPDGPRASYDHERWQLRLRLATASALILAGLAVVVSGGWVG